MPNPQEQIEALKAKAESLNDMAHTARLGGHTELFERLITQAVTVIEQKQQLEAKHDPPVDFFDGNTPAVQTIDGAWAIKQALNHTIRFSECPAADGWWTPQMLVECAIEDGVLEVSFDADFLRCVDIAQNLLPEPSNW